MDHGYDRCVRTHYGVLALMSSAQLGVVGILDIDHPAPDKHRQPGEEQVFHPHKGDASLQGSNRANQVSWLLYSSPSL